MPLQYALARRSADANASAAPPLPLPHTLALPLLQNRARPSPPQRKEQVQRRVNAAKQLLAKQHTRLAKGAGPGGDEAPYGGLPHGVVHGGVGPGGGELAGSGAVVGAAGELSDDYSSSGDEEV